MNVTPGNVVFTVGPAGRPNGNTDRIGCGRVESLHDEVIDGRSTPCAFVQFFSGKAGSWPVAQLRSVGVPLAQ